MKTINKGHAQNIKRTKVAILFAISLLLPVKK